MTLTSKAKSLIEAHEKEKNSKSWGLSVYVGLAVSDAADIAKRMLELEEQNKKLVNSITGAQAQLELFNFAKDEIRVRRADDILNQAIEAAEKGEG